MPRGLGLQPHPCCLIAVGCSPGAVPSQKGFILAPHTHGLQAESAPLINQLYFNLKKKKVLCLPLCSLYSHSKKGGGEECLISNRDPSDNLNIATDLGFPEAPVAENVPANAGDVRDACSIPGWGRGGHGNPLQYFCLENPRGQRSLAGDSPWGHKESTTTEETWHAHTDNI